MAESIPPWLKHLWKELTSPPAFLAGKTGHSSGHAKAPSPPPPGKKAGWVKPAPQPPVHPHDAESPWEDGESAGPEPSAERPASKTRPRPGRPPSPPVPKPKTATSGPRPNTRPPAPSAAEGSPKPHPSPAAPPPQAEPAVSAAWTVRSNMRAWGYDPEVLGAYPYVFTRISRHGRALRLQSARATVALKRTSFSPLHLEALHDVLRFAASRGAAVPHWIMPRHAGGSRTSRTPFVRGSDGLYYAVQWLEGGPVDLGSAADMARAAESLSRFHHLTRLWSSGSDTGARRGDLPDAYDIFERLSRRTEELEKILQKSENGRSPGEVDRFYAEHAPAFIAQAHEALDWLLSPDCQKRLDQEREAPTVCHMDLTPGNLVRKDNRVYLIDFDYLARAPRTLDLAHMLRRGLQTAGWSPQLGLTGLLHYNTACTLTRAEYVLLRAFLTFPHRWWRAARRWQDGIWTEEEALRNLRRCVREETARHKFLQWFRRHALGR